MDLYKNYSSNSYKPYEPEPEQPKKRNQVRESMISMMSQAFEFEDFLGETTTMKDKVPKNKNNSGKTIVHFSRDVEEQIPNKNPLQTANTANNVSRKSTFEMYMDDWSFNKPKEEEYKFKQPQNNYVSSYQPPIYQENVGNYYSDYYGKENSSNNSYLNFKDKNPSVPNTYVSKYTTPTNNYLNYDTKKETSTLTKEENKFSYTFDASPTTNYTYEPVQVQTPTFNNPTTWDSVSQQQNYKPASYTTNLTNKKYDAYGEYAKDFSSPDIMAILNKRSNKVMDQKSMNYSNNYNTTY